MKEHICERCVAFNGKGFIYRRKAKTFMLWLLCASIVAVFLFGLYKIVI